MRVKRLDERIREYHFPSLQKIESLSLHEDDTIIICAGFEDRSSHILEEIKESGSDPGEVIIVDYLPFMEDNRLSQMQEICKSSGFLYSVYQYDRENPANGGYSLLDSVKSDVGRIYLDISGMTRLLIIQMIEAATKKMLVDKLVILYTMAETYPPGEDVVIQELEKLDGQSDLAMFLSSGVFDVAIVPELSSVAMQSQPTRLIAFPSFNPYQLMAARIDVQPSFITLVNGIPAERKNIWRLEAIRKLNNLDDLPEFSEINTSTLDYRGTLSSILDIYKKHGDMERIVISPMGSKMQVVAIAIIRAFLSDIQIIYPTPNELFSDSYTHGASDIFQLDMEGLSSINE